jgi:hypothetical protein
MDFPVDRFGLSDQASNVSQEEDELTMTKTRHMIRWLLGAGMLVGLLSLQGCSDPEDFSSNPKAKVTKDDIQKAQFEKDKAAGPAKKPGKGR